MKSKLKILTGLSLLSLSITSFGGTLTFSLLNDKNSVQNPITITAGHVQSQSLSSDCNGLVIKDVSNLKVSTTEKTSIQADTSAVPAACWDSGKAVDFQLVIETVDGKPPKSAPCGTFLTTYSQNDNVAQQIPLTIYEFDANFYCQFGPSTH